MEGALTIPWRELGNGVVAEPFSRFFKLTPWRTWLVKPLKKAIGKTLILKQKTSFATLSYERVGCILSLIMLVRNRGASYGEPPRFFPKFCSRTLPLGGSRISRTSCHIHCSVKS